MYNIKILTPVFLSFTWLSIKPVIKKIISASILIRTEAASGSTMKILWKWCSFAELSSQELYAILRLRQQIFVVEQQCAYLDSDDLDQHCYHLVGWHKRGAQVQPIAYLRILPQERKGKLPTIGRVLIRLDFRNKGIGREIMQRGLNRLEELCPGSPVQISAQLYLTSFYESLGFVKSSDKYDEDGIPHIEMIRSPDRSVGLEKGSV